MAYITSIIIIIIIIITITIFISVFRRASKSVQWFKY
jgi:hypothetical protein